MFSRKNNGPVFRLFLCLSRLNLHDVNLGVHDAVQKQVGPQILLIRLHNGDQIQHRF